MKQPEITLEELFLEAKRATKYVLPMPSAKARGTLSVDDTEFHLKRAPREAKDERFPLRSCPEGQLHFPAPARESVKEASGAWSSKVWTPLGVIRAIQAGCFFTTGLHEFQSRTAAHIAISGQLAGLNVRTTALHLLQMVLEEQARTSAAASRQRLNGDALLDQILQAEE